MENIKKNSKFVACWGYDQTQYSVYNVVAITGKSVIVEGLNDWSSLSENDLCAGAQVKIYTYPPYEERNPEEWDLGIDRWDYARIMKKRAAEVAEVHTIMKMNRIDGESWTYLWVLDDGQVINSKELYKNNQFIEIIKGMKKCLVNTKYDKPSIKIDQCITAHLDIDYGRNEERYIEQNLHTAYNGR